MKKIVAILYLLIGVFSVNAFAQDIGTSFAPPPSGRGTVGQPMMFEASIESLGGSYTNFQWTLSFPTEYLSTPNSPTGGLNWVQINPGTWQTTVPNLSGVMTTTITVTPIAPSTTNLQTAISTVSGFWENNQVTTNDNARATFYIDPAAQNTITVSPATTSANIGSPVTLTASGCTNGTFTWSPGGQTGNTLTINAAAGATTYTATCSTGGSGTATVTGTEVVVPCAANAGTLN